MPIRHRRRAPVRLDGARNLQLRPAAHSLTLALVTGAIAYLVSRSPATGWALFAALASHVLRNASTGTAPLLSPLPSNSVPRWLYYGGELDLLWLSHFLAFR